jgi:hypothetical protein
MAALVAVISQALLQNEYEPAALAGVNLLLEHSPERLEAALIDLVPDRRRARAGETLRVSAVLQTFRGERRVETVELRLPADLRPGPLTIVAGDALRLALRESEAGAALRPRSLDELIRLVNNLRSFDRLYVVGLRREATAVLGAEPLPHLPPSRALALVGKDEMGSASLVRERSLFEEAIPLGLTPRGFRRVTVEVLPALGAP